MTTSTNGAQRDPPGWRRRTFVIGAVVSIAAVLLSGSAPADDTQAVADFGVSKSKPIDDGFLFHGGQYMEAPYVVERRGLDIYINGILMRRGQEWPPYDFHVNQDPGDPPPNTSPFDPAPKGVDARDTYWQRKWRFVRTHYEEDDAYRMMRELYARCDKFAGVDADPRSPSRFTVADKAGNKTVVDLKVSPRQLEYERNWPPKKEDVLARAEQAQAYYEGRLQPGAILAKGGSAEITIGGDHAIALLDAIASDMGADDKERLIYDKDLLRQQDSAFRDLARVSSPNAQMKARLQLLKEKIAKAQSTEAQDRIVLGMKSDLDARTAAVATSLGNASQPSEQPENAGGGSASTSGGDEPVVAVSIPSRDRNRDMYAVACIVAVLAAACLGAIFTLYSRRRRVKMPGLSGPTSTDVERSQPAERSSS